MILRPMARLNNRPRYVPKSMTVRVAFSCGRWHWRVLDLFGSQLAAGTARNSATACAAGQDWKREHRKQILFSP